MAIRSETTAVISTSHLTEVESDKMDSLLDSRDVIGNSKPGGWIIYTGLVCNSSETSNLNYVLGFMLGRGYTWVMFDSIGNVYDELETYKW